MTDHSHAVSGLCGSYVFHCHILPHEDAGMMQVLTVVENTDSSWLVAAQGFEQIAGGVRVHQAQNYAPVILEAEAPGFRTCKADW